MQDVAEGLYAKYRLDDVFGFFFIGSTGVGSTRFSRSAPPFRLDEEKRLPVYFEEIPS
jgi:hypothetical protein